MPRTPSSAPSVTSNILWETMTRHSAHGATTNSDSMTNKPKPSISVWQYCIILSALKAQKRLRERGLTGDEIRECLGLLRIGQDLVMRLQRDGAQLPEIDLSHTPPAAAAPLPDVQGWQPAGADKGEQNGRR